MKQRETDLEYVRVKLVKGKDIKDLLFDTYTGVSRDHSYANPLEVNVAAGHSAKILFGVITTKDYFASDVTMELKRRDVLKGYLPDEFPNINIKLLPYTHEREDGLVYGHHLSLTDMERREINEKRIAIFWLYVKNKTKETITYTDIGIHVYGKAGLKVKQKKLSEIFDVRVNLTGVHEK